MVESTNAPPPVHGCATLCISVYRPDRRMGLGLGAWLLAGEIDYSTNAYEEEEGRRVLLSPPPIISSAMSAYAARLGA